jgi:hypothetical protein
MWHIHPLLGNDREIGDGTAASARQRPSTIMSCSELQNVCELTTEL